MKNLDSLISVIIPMWNGEAYIEETVQSVLLQDMETEIIVVDDGSTDGSRERLSGYDCTLLPMSRSGIARTCNTGLRHARGTYLMFLDQDDVLCEGSLGVMMDAFHQDGSVQAVAAMARDFISPDLDGEAKETLVPRTAPYHGLLTGSVLMRRDVPDIVGGFNETYRAGQAVDYLMRIEQSGIKGARLNFVSVLRRLHATNTSRTMKDKQFGDYGAILRAKLAGAASNG